MRHLIPDSPDSGDTILNYQVSTSDNAITFLVL